MITFRAFVAKQYHDDMYVRFEQVDLAGPTIDSLFVDVPAVAAPPNGPAAEIIRIVAQEAWDESDRPHARRREVPSAHTCGAARLLLHPDWQGNAVIVGGPGAGKTTLTQLVCQTHRERILGHNPIDESTKDHAPPRLPIRLELRKYARWRDELERKQAKASRRARQHAAIELYMAEMIDEGSGTLGFRSKDLVAIGRDHSLLIVLDGLDEIGNPTLRAQVLDDISSFSGRIGQICRSAVVVVTTRPGDSSGNVLGSLPGYTHLTLQRLTDELRISYMNKWARQARLSEEQKNQLISNYQLNQDAPHVRELASNPMQLAILLHLLQRRGVLPEQRTDLYAQYVQVFLDRESPKEEAVARHRLLIEEIHGFVALHLQFSAEMGRSTGSLPIADLRALVASYVMTQSDDASLIDSLFTAVTSRVICLVQRELGKFEFEVQPLREYFAARFIFDNSPPQGAHNHTRDDCLNALIKRPYWTNVMRFFVGMLSKGETRGLTANLASSSQLPGHRGDPLTQRVAVQLIEDQVYRSHSDETLRDISEFILDGSGTGLAAQGLLSATGEPLVLTGAPGRALVTVCKERLSRTDRFAERASLSTLLRAAVPQSELRSWWWAQYDQSHLWLETAALLNTLNGMDGRGRNSLRDAAGDGRVELDLLECLVLGGADETTGALIGSITRELGRGRRIAEDGTLWANLIEAFDPVLPHVLRRRSALNASSYNLNRLAVPNSDELRQLSSEERARAEAVMHHISFVRRMIFPGKYDWNGYIASLFSAVGTSALLMTALVVAYSDELARYKDDTAPALQLRVSWELAAREHRSDSAWWVAESRDLSEAETVHWLLSLLARGRTSCIIDLLETIDERVRSLSEDAQQRLIRTIENVSVMPRFRHRDLHHGIEAAGRNGYSSVTYTLLWIISPESKRKELASKIVESEGGDRQSMRFLGTTFAAIVKNSGVKVSMRHLEPLRGHQGRLDDLPLPSLAPLTGGAVLREADNWPQSVNAAALAAFDRDLDRQGPLADLASRDNWLPGVPRSLFPPAD